MIHSILSIMVKVEVSKTSQIEVFNRQFQQYLIRNPLIECRSDQLTTPDFYIAQDKHRLVKQPGYEIFLEDVSRVHFVCGENILLSYESKGVYYETEFKTPKR